MIKQKVKSLIWLNFDKEYRSICENLNSITYLDRHFLLKFKKYVSFRLRDDLDIEKASIEYWVHYKDIKKYKSVSVKQLIEKPLKFEHCDKDTPVKSLLDFCLYVGIYSFILQKFPN